MRSWTQPLENLAIVIIFVTVGFLMNFCQFGAFIVFWHLNRDIYRDLVHAFQFGHWSIVSWIGFHYSGSRLKVICSDQDLNHLGKEAAILVPNHRYSLDFLTTVMIPDQFGALGILKAMQKNSIKFMPIIGWNFWFTENIFLARNAPRDIKRIDDGILELVKSKKPFWMTLYAEGSRFTNAKHEASEEIAKEKNYKSLKHHLQPRPTGFSTVVQQLRKNTDQPVYIYDMTIQQQNNENKAMSYLLSLNPVEFTVFIRRVNLTEIPDGNEAEWLRELYQRKDHRFEHMLNNDLKSIFKEENVKIQSLDVPHKSKIMFVFWCLTILPVTIICWILFMKQSLPCLIIGIAFPILAQFLVSQIIRTGDMKSSSSYGLKKD